MTTHRCQQRISNHLLFRISASSIDQKPQNENHKLHCCQVHGDVVDNGMSKCSINIFVVWSRLRYFRFGGRQPTADSSIKLFYGENITIYDRKHCRGRFLLPHETCTASVHNYCRTWSFRFWISFDCGALLVNAAIKRITKYSKKPCTHIAQAHIL